jgi:hypothetical protein
MSFAGDSISLIYLNYNIDMHFNIKSVWTRMHTMQKAEALVGDVVAGTGVDAKNGTSNRHLRVIGRESGGY